MLKMKQLAFMYMIRCICLIDTTDINDRDFYLKSFPVSAPAPLSAIAGYMTNSKHFKVD